MKWRTIAEYSLLILPAIALGVFAMINAGVSPVIWGQQIAAWIVLPLIAKLLKRALWKISPAAWSILLLAMLAGTLLGEEAGGARRWLDFGVVQANAAMLILPALLTVTCRMKYPHMVWLGAAAILSFQPDLSQLAAFGAAALPVFWLREKKFLWKILGFAVCAALMIRCASVPPSLETVPYCEGILTMLGDTAVLLKIAGWIALLAIPACFMVQFRRQKKLHLLCWCIYDLISVLFVLTGEYPTPFVGFGISAIAGFWLGFVADTEEK